MTNFLRKLFFLLIVRPLVLIILGLNVRHRERLPRRGPALIVANHNSHLDTMVLMSLFPLKSLRHIRPVAAMDYFQSSKLMAWFSLKIIGIIPMDREARSRGEDPLAGASDALHRRDILILFPEGTRGAPEELADFKKGVSHLVERASSTMPAWTTYSGDPVQLTTISASFMAGPKLLNGTARPENFSARSSACCCVRLATTISLAPPWLSPWAAISPASPAPTTRTCNPSKAPNFDFANWAQARLTDSGLSPMPVSRRT